MPLVRPDLAVAVGTVVKYSSGGIQIFFVNTYSILFQILSALNIFDGVLNTCFRIEYIQSKCIVPFDLLLACGLKCFHFFFFHV